jgi:hypothetical protein
VDLIPEQALQIITFPKLQPRELRRLVAGSVPAARCPVGPRTAVYQRGPVLRSQWTTVAVQMAPRTRATVRMTASETASRTLIAQVLREA